MKNTDRIAPLIEQAKQAATSDDGDTMNANHRAALAHEAAAVAWAEIIGLTDDYDERLRTTDSVLVEDGEDFAQWDATSNASEQLIRLSEQLLGRQLRAFGRLLDEARDATSNDFRDAYWSMVDMHRKIAFEHRKAGWKAIIH